jgi:putative DNA primase/helicase
VLDLASCTFRPGRPDDYIKTFCPVDWLGFDILCPTWEKFMADIMAGDMEMVGYIKRLLGSAISGQVIEHILPIFWGERGRNGKTVLLEVLAYCLGGLAGPVAGELLLADKYPRSSAAPSPDRMSMRGKRVLWASEIDEGVRLAAGRIKMLTGGDTIIARGPFDRREIRFRPTHQLLLLTNHRPRVNADDAALWQRIHLVEFQISFVDNPVGDKQKPRNPHIASELKEEAPAILSWLVAGYYEWLEKGLAPPPPVLGATQKYRSSEDWFSQFVDDCCMIQEGAFCYGGEIYDVYKSWCKDGGLKPQRKKFYEKLRSQYNSVKTEYGKLYGGIGLLTADGTDGMTAKSLDFQK